MGWVALGVALAWSASGTARPGPHAGAPAAAGAAGVKGKVAGWEKLIPQVYADAAKPDAHRFSWREPSPTVKQDFRRLSADPARDVCVVALASATAPPHEPIAVRVTGGRTSWSTLVLSPDSRLSFKNVDPFPHVLYEVGNPQWAPNPTAPGSSREWTAGGPGVHEIRDQLFPSVVLRVVVNPSALEVAFPDHEGAFVLPLPPGEYTLKTFFDGKQVGKDVTLHAEKGTEIKEALSLGGESKP